MANVLILGGYGNFGKRIAEKLAARGVAVIIAGRDETKTKAIAAGLSKVRAVAFDVNAELDTQLASLKPVVVVNTCGPFQNRDYRVAAACIRHGAHYIDLADGRDFVRDIAVLDGAAKERGVAVISGASTVPGLSSAVIEHFKPAFSRIDDMIYGISPGQGAERGLATTQGILTYVGKPLKPFAGQSKPVYGWQDLYRQEYPVLGKRWMANCDIPDLDLLPSRYGIASIRFSAGLELGVLHLGLWGLSWAVRMGAALHLPAFAKPLLAVSNLFNRFGTSDGGMHVILRGVDTMGKPLEKRWFIIAREGHGPYIPCMPAVVLAEKLVSGVDFVAGAYPCVGLVTLEEYMLGLNGLAIAAGEDLPNINA
ncbi:MAG: saccharopine dehydrogenase NADP-binding domain-containing protein [Alphaproteobacteria bacterium]|nr:saccharopine dehydrogenase NADP-binding domain-containing protein [Alphaproteobacteria bacterium]